MVPVGGIGGHLVVMLIVQVEVLVVGSHLQVILQGDKSQLPHREGVVLVKESQVNMVEDIQSLQVATIGVFPLDPPLLGQITHRQPVVGQGTPLALRHPA